MERAQNLQPGAEPIDAEIAFGDPDAAKKARANMDIYPYCIARDVHCPWSVRCHEDPGWICPLDAEERNCHGPAEKNRD